MAASMAGTRRDPARICVSTIMLEPDRWTPAREAGNLRLPAILTATAAAGFRAVEIWQGHILGLDRAGLEACARQAQELAIAVAAVGAYLDMAATGEALTAQEAKLDCLCVAAQRFQTPLLKYFAGPCNFEEADADCRSQAGAGLERLVQRAEAAGVTLTAELHPNTLTNGLEGCRWWLAQHRSPRHRLLFQAPNETERAVAYVQALASGIHYVHLFNVRGGQYAALSDGDLGVARLLRALKASGYDGWFCLEFARGCRAPREAFHAEGILTAAREDAAFLQQVWAE